MQIRDPNQILTADQHRPTGPGQLGNLTIDEQIRKLKRAAHSDRLQPVGGSWCTKDKLVRQTVEVKSNLARL